MKVLKLGLPKGSLQEATLELFRMAGFNISVNPRSYFPSIDDSEIKPVLLRAQEMSRYVEEGVLDCGITGEDWILENNSNVLRLAELVYAKRTKQPVRWVVAVREDSRIKELKDLEGKRIATELVNFTKRFFKKKGISVEEVLEGNPGLATEPLYVIMALNPIVSILEAKSQSETIGLEGGGAMKQTFVWCEKYPLLDFGCTFFLPPWPAVLPFLSNAIGFCYEPCGGGSH